MASALHIPASRDPLVLRYREHVRVEKRLAARRTPSTPSTGKVLAVCGRGQRAAIAIADRPHPPLCGADAQWRAQGAALRSFSRAGVVSSSGPPARGDRAQPVQDVHAPQGAKPPPKALGVDDAVRLANHAEGRRRPVAAGGTRPWSKLLYGCGLRVGELVGLDAAPAPIPSAWAGWIDLRGAEAHVLGKGRRNAAAARGRCGPQALQAWLQLRATPFAPGALDTALFVGQRAKRLSAQSVWLRLRAQRAGGPDHAGAPAHAAPLVRQPPAAIEVATCVPCRNCWATPASPPRRSTPGWITSTWPGVRPGPPRARRKCNCMLLRWRKGC